MNQKLLDIFDEHISNGYSNGYSNKDNIKKIYDYYSKKYIYECTHIPTNNIMTIHEISNIHKPSTNQKEVVPFIYSEYISNCKENEKISLDKFIELFNQYKLNYYKLHSFNINNYIEPKIKERDVINIYNFVFTSRYISVDIKLWIQQNVNKYAVYNFEHLEFYHFYNDANGLDYKEFIDNVYAISKWIYNINPIYKIKLYFFDTPIQKVLPKICKGIKYISSQNASSGFTSINDEKNYREIFIWRKEEFYLILIHELFHYLLLDTKFLNQDKYITILNYKIGGELNFPLLINETITEIMAEFFYLIVVSIKNNDDFLEIYKKNFIYNWYQFSKIMNFYNITTFDSKLLATRFNQTTNIFSYFILKCILETEFCNIIFAFPYIYKLLPSKEQNKNDCNIKECSTIVSYISRKMLDLPIKIINQNIKYNDKDKDKDKSLKRSLYNV